MGLMEQLPLQNWGQKTKPYLSSTVAAVTMPFGREQIPGSSHYLSLPVGIPFPDPLPSSPDPHHQAEEEVDNRQSCCAPFGGDKGSVSFTFPPYFQKWDNKCCTIFSGAVECRISPASYFPTGMLSSEHFCLLALHPEISRFSLLPLPCMQFNF